MAEQIVIPKFREKVTYWKTAGGTEVSYPVSASFKGILRLSPNDDLTLQEKQPIALYDDDIESYYRDSIDPAITQQFVRVSISDGYFINLRFTQYEMEADSLYVIGPAQFNMVRLFTTKDNAIKLKTSTALPARVNTNLSSLIDSSDMIMKDISGVDPHSPVDQSYTLVSRTLDERLFTYQQTTQLIRELVVESLLDLQTIPTGSIQHIPITIKEYEKMIMEGYPNSYYKIADGKTETPNDPIIRDYLICDGSLYYNKQFPELAKILEGERIDYWRYDSEKQRLVQATHINDYENSDEKVFRVPDLRARFIRSIFMDRDLSQLGSNTTGIYTCDARPPKANYETDKHVHFVSTGFYQPNPNIWGVKQVATIVDDNNWKLNDYPGVLHPHNSMLERYPGHYGWWYNTSRYSSGCVEQIVYANHAGYFLSIPLEYDFQNPTQTPNCGLSSVDMASCLETPEKDEDVSYNKRTDFIDYVSGSGAVGSYGMENTPEFYCMLPLIKI